MIRIGFPSGKPLAASPPCPRNPIGMNGAILSLPTVDALCQHVHQTLCEHDQLDLAQTPLQKSLVQRRGQPCGLFFSVQGPRRVKGYAVWTGDENRILFYDSAGVRFAETRLMDGPDPRKLAA